MPIATIAKMMTKGQITVPKRVRDQLGLVPGDELEFIELEGKYVVRRHLALSRFAKYRGALAHLRAGSRCAGGRAAGMAEDPLDQSVLATVSGGLVGSCRGMDYGLERGMMSSAASSSWPKV
jgi:AbrB family looped-hinge helix DNA binding protein